MTRLIKDTLSLFDPISLAEMEDYRLLNRIDTKFICHVQQLQQILSLASTDFKIQTSGGNRIFGYESLYFDTPDMKNYFDHHQGKRIRYKIRFRKYLDSGDVFLEIKKKKNDIRTDKKRKEFDFCTSLNNQHIDFLNNYIEVPKSGFTPAIYTNFNRITLTGKNRCERITIDTGIHFKNNFNQINLPYLSIIEVKCNKAEGISAFTKILKDSRVCPLGISKYILGNILLTPRIKHNRFLYKINTINKICYAT
ncbi:MAG: hypothetical protein A2X13_03100 [Bacteroidetes bacterium GWC2_33_15]|nr:MAG: hypothetical protein A2X10_09635 [Bacteroidetes bacterium GWA2_33_15]OFX49533.1 MAG: hypothetical protein A2X13_03100 [Bacteroidetes bacterium GWC2_33_15]OFX63628.1 MAG: hypothetical protein A2X15_01125 [Bacteroidetes bacterium GWB2_32_14]OFX68842.1 MAG: hypothetical protein A2X14_13120 [Bacteroidetes bacterium GWD2_33_33]HAN17562.1 VTC domain-containing protein [Bacteroidales bacterium]